MRTWSLSFVIAAATLPFLACERPTPPPSASADGYETGALSLRVKSSSRQAWGTYHPATGRFTRRSPQSQSRFYQVQLLADRYLTLEQMPGKADISATGRNLQDEVHELWGFKPVGARYGPLTRVSYYASDGRCLENGLFRLTQRLEYQWTDSCLVIWLAAAPSQRGVASLGVARPAIQLFFNQEGSVEADQRGPRN